MPTVSDLKNYYFLDAAMNDLKSLQTWVEPSDRVMCGSLLAQYYQQNVVDFSNKQLEIFIKITKAAYANYKLKSSGYSKNG